MTNIKNILSRKSPLCAFLCGVFFSIVAGIIAAVPLSDVADKEAAALLARDEYSLDVVFKFFGIWALVIFAAFIAGVLLYLFAFKPNQHANQN
jgi:hypothetical protein